MGAAYTACCCHYYLQHNREEKNAILRLKKTRASRPPERVPSESSDSDPGEESLFGPQPSRRNPWNIQQSQRNTVDPWATANRPSAPTMRQELDRELQAFISMRDQADKDTEEWEKLNYDIHTLRYARREVSTRWRKILLQLGYQCEVEALLCVNRQSRLSRDWEHLNRAAELLQQLLDHTSLFPAGAGHHNRYLYVMDRLLSLDSAEDFIRLAKHKYPKKDD
ncbi:melanoregulin [Centroberyx gerrardi]